MSAGAVRQGRVFVEIGADPKTFLAAVGKVNRQISDLGQSATDLGVKLGIAGTAITAPIAAAAAAFASLGDFVQDVGRQSGINAGNIEGLTAAAARLGMVVDRQAARSALALSKAMGELSLATRAVALNVGSVMAPAMTGIAKIMTDSAASLSRFIAANPQLVKMLAAVGVSTVAAGAAFGALGMALRFVGGGLSSVLSPIASMVKQTAILAVNLVRLGVGFVAANFGALTMLAGVGAVIAVLATFTNLLTGVGQILAGSFASAMQSGQEMFAGLAVTASATVQGMFDALANGDLGGAVDILWLGAQAAWARGKSTFMSAVDGFVGWFQDAFDVMGFSIAQTWEKVYAGVQQVFNLMSAYMTGAWDNIVNTFMPGIDEIVGSIQKLMVRIQDFWSGATDTEAKLKAIDDKNRQRAEDRAKTNPGKDARLEEARTQNAAIAAAAQSAADSMQAALDQRISERGDRTASRRAARGQEIADIEARLAEATKAVADRATGVGGPGQQRGGFSQALSGPAQTIGTFSAVAAGGLGFGTKGIPEQQLDVLKQIAAGVRGGFGNVGA
jgi:hypothetical protein